MMARCVFHIFIHVFSHFQALCISWLATVKDTFQFYNEVDVDTNIFQLPLPVCGISHKHIRSLNLPNQLEYPVLFLLKVE